MIKMLKKKNDPLYLYKLGMMIAIELLVAFSPIGYIEMKPFTVTLMHVTVIVGAFFLGPFEGMILGGIFGLTSVWKASILGINYSDHIFSPFISGFPFSSLILSVGTRMAFGFLSGLLFEMLERIKCKKTAVSIGALISAYIHSFLVYTAAYFLFPEIGVTPLSAFQGMFSISNIIYVLTPVVVLLIIYTISINEKVKEFQRQIKIIEMSKRTEKNKRVLLSFAGIITLLVMSIAYHFFTRMQLVLSESGVVLSPFLLREFLHIGMQFFISSLSLIFLIMMVFMFIRKYSNEMALRSELDIMTGIYNKGAVISYIKEKLKKVESSSSGVFIILDIDYFKKINDNYGHLYGDMVLIRVAEILMNSFRKNGIVGRFGGDEFCIFVYNAYSEEWLKHEIKKITQLINEIEVPNNEEIKISCSIGISLWQGNEKSFEELYQEADSALYIVKNKGRNGYAFWEEE